MIINATTISRPVAVVSIQKENLSNRQPARTYSEAEQQPSQDKVSFSSTDHVAASLTRAALQSLPSRQAKVDALKQTVSAGEYQLDSAKIAASLANASV
jgi:flagellar biosynthesis anti-sigma factor FlgM